MAVSSKGVETDTQYNVKSYFEKVVSVFLGKKIIKHNCNANAKKTKLLQTTFFKCTKIKHAEYNVVIKNLVM